MPIKPIFPNSRAGRTVPIHPKLIQKLNEARKLHKQSLIEIVNRRLALEFFPDLIKEFDAYKAKPMKFSNRVTRNRFTGKK